MGKLWDVIGEGEVWSIADYSARHFKETGRCLRIAVDAACWRFANLTDEQVRKIQEGEPAANPIEKTILWRILRLWKLNIQLIFVEDGPHRPWKRGKRGSGRINFELIRLTRQLLDKLRIPYRRAPSEAEAECARMQALGIVDAVWTDDGDAMMFGCQTLIKQHRRGQTNVKDYIRVYRASAILEKHDLDSESLVLFAMLAGGDYDVKGLPGCGPKTAALLSRRHLGLAHALFNASKHDLPRWREQLRETAVRCGKCVDIPSDFPNWRAVGYYRNPHISTAETLFGHPGWDRRIDQMALRVMLRERFNFTTREYTKHLAPVFLTRFLVGGTTTPAERTENLKFGVQLKRTKAKKVDGEPAPPKPEVKITFSPMHTVEIDLRHRPPEEDWSKFEGKDGTPYDPTQDVETEILECLLRNGLPEGHFEVLQEQIQPAKRKRTKDDEVDQSAKKPKSRSSPQDDDVERRPYEQRICQDLNSPASEKPIPKKRGRPPKNASLSSTSAKKSTSKATKDRSEKDEPVQTQVPSSPPIPTFKRPRALPAAIIDLSGDDSDRVYDDLAFGSIADLTAEAARQSSTYSQHHIVPGDIISPDVLRALRAGSMLLGTRVQSVGPPAASVGAQKVSNTMPSEVIDLT